MKMLAPASQGWLWALDKAAVLWLVLITAIFNINIILMGRFHIFQECKSKLELTRIWTLGFSFFLSQSADSQELKKRTVQPEPVPQMWSWEQTQSGGYAGWCHLLPHSPTTRGCHSPCERSYWLPLLSVRQACPFSWWDRPELESPGVKRGATGCLVARRPEEPARTRCQSWERVMDWCGDTGHMASDGLLWGSGQGVVV